MKEAKVFDAVMVFLLVVLLFVALMLYTGLVMKSMEKRAIVAGHAKYILDKNTLEKSFVWKSIEEMQADKKLRSVQNEQK